MASYGSVQTVPGWLLSVRDRNLTATPFDEERATVSPPGLSVAGDANFDSGVWRGVFSASRTGLLAYQLAREGEGGLLTWFDMTGHPMGTIGERSESFAMRLSPDGRRASVIQGDPNNDIWIYELERGVRARLTTDESVLPSPLWSPDGSEILFVRGNPAEAQNPDYVVATIPSFGAGEKKIILRSPVRLETTDWSRDGRYLLFDKGNIGATDIWAMAFAQPDKPFPVVQTPFLDTTGLFSPDGRWIAYVSMQTGVWEVFVTAFPAGGAPYQVSASGGRLPLWSADGKTLYFIGPEERAHGGGGRRKRSPVRDSDPEARCSRSRCSSVRASRTPTRLRRTERGCSPTPRATSRSRALRSSPTGPPGSRSEGPRKRNRIPSEEPT